MGLCGHIDVTCDQHSAAVANISEECRAVTLKPARKHRLLSHRAISTRKRHRCYTSNLTGPIPSAQFSGAFFEHTFNTLTIEE